MRASDHAARKRADSISAALRHVRDAEHLASSGPHQSLDQAFHLAGFGPECARKACLSERWADKAVGHGFGAETEHVLGVVLSLDVQAHRYHPESWNDRYPALDSWTEVSRYWPSGRADEAATTALVAAARSAVDEVVLALWSDGVLLGDALDAPEVL